MATTLAPEVLSDELALSLARVMASANRRARELGVDADQSVITISQRPHGADLVWRINYGPRDYIGRRGGDLIIDIDARSLSVTQVLSGQ